MNNQITTIGNYQNPKAIFDNLDVSEATRADYKQRISMFMEFVAGRGLNRNSFLEFKRHLADRDAWAVATKNKYLATAKVFLKELNRQGVLPTDITQNTKHFSQSKKHKLEGLTEAEVATVSKTMQSLPVSSSNSRLKAILSLLTLQGLRQIEIIRLDVKDIDLVAKTAFVQTKGSDDKEAINLHPETSKALKEYIKSNKRGDGALFVSCSNNSRNQRLTTRSLRQIVQTTLKDLGIDKTTHGFRHYFTSTLVKTYKGDLLEVARYTRHKSLEMLQVYNDNIKHQADLPRFYLAFKGVSF